MQCPKCSSNDTVSCPIAYEQGTTESTAESKVSGYVTGAQSGYMTGSNTTTTTSQTAFARRAAPPIAPGWAWPLPLGIPVTLLFALAAWLVSGHMWQFYEKLAYLSGFVTVVWFLARRPAYRRARDAYLTRLREWQNSWICRSCGAKFLPK